MSPIAWEIRGYRLFSFSGCTLPSWARGREITKQACDHLGLKHHKKKDNTEQPELFEKNEST
jgi:hypothetical protein